MPDSMLEHCYTFLHFLNLFKNYKNSKIQETFRIRSVTWFLLQKSIQN